jgi:hypothetical protein
MKLAPRLGTLTAATVAVILSLTAPALAKGGGTSGGGGGGGGVVAPAQACAQITSFTNTLGYTLGHPSVSTAVTVTETCIDEVPPTLVIALRDDTTGKIVAQSATANPILRTITAGFIGTGSSPYTVLATLETATGSGKILDQRSESLTLLPDLAPAA